MKDIGRTQFRQRLVHPIPPTFDAFSRVLILGSFPSVKSREGEYFYFHPQNRFWRVLGALFDEQVPLTAEGRRLFLLSKRIAVWDVVMECDITGSADSTIENVVPTDLRCIFAAADIRAVYTNGRKADSLYRRYQLGATGREAVCLPSTSPANAAWSLERLTGAWRVIMEKLEA